MTIRLALAAVPVRVINRHGKAARKTRARLFRPVTAPAFTELNIPTKTNT